MIVNITDPYRHTGTEIIQDFTGYREVRVRKVDPSMIGAEAKCCIDNSKALAEYGDLKSVKGFYTHDMKVGLFHYWNYCDETDTYWDSTPSDCDMRYFIKESQE
jgi:hypothetical protein